MTELTTQLTAGVIRPADCDRSGLGGCTNLFFLDGDGTAGRVSLVEHRIAPRTLASPMHLHENEDEFSFVLSGQVAAVSAGREVLASVGELIVKPRGEWHAFWNPGDEPATLLEVISPAGLENLFRTFSPSEPPEPETLIAMARDYGCQVDFRATMELAGSKSLSM
jgi:mannose-6-phosphate isomerase-like protein (cupin superfamily)